MTDFKILPSVNGTSLFRDNVSTTDRLLGRVSAGSGVVEEIPITDFVQTLLDDTDASTVRTTLGLVIGTDVQAQDTELSALAGLTSAADKLPYFTGVGTASLTDLSAFGRTLIDDANAATAQTTLGLVIGTNVQAQDAELSAIAGLTSAADRLPYFTGSGTAALATFTAFGRTLAALADASAGRTALGLVIGTDVQAQDAELAAIAGLTSAADRLPYFTGSGTASLATFSAFARTLIDDADATTMRTTLGLVIGTNVQAQDAELQAIAGLTSAADALPYFTGVGTASVTTLTSFIRTLLDDANAATAQTTLGLVIGTNVQAYNANLTSYATVTPSAYILTLLDDANAATAQTTLGLVIGTNVQAQDAELSALAGLTSAADALPYFTGVGTASVTTLSAFARTLIDDVDAATMRTTLGLISGGAGDIWVKKAGDTMSGDLTLNSTLTLSQGTQDYVFSSVTATVLELQSKLAATGSTFRMFASDGDATDGVSFEIFGKGLPASLTNRERLIMYWDNVNNWYAVRAEAAGTGIARDLHIYTQSNTNQLVLDTAGNLGFGTNDIEAWQSTRQGANLGSHAGAFWGKAIAGLYLMDNAYYDGTWKYRTTAAATYIGLAAGTFAIGVGASGTIDTAITWIAALTAIATGEVGIGVSPVVGMDLDIISVARSRSTFLAKNIGTFGDARLVSGDATRSGYIGWFRPHTDAAAGTRSGYLGWDATNIVLTLENSAIFQVTGGIANFVNGITLAAGTDVLAAYDIGTWSPTLRFGGLSTGITYSSRVGNYIRIGNMVFCSGQIFLSNNGTATGVADIAGLPFTVNSTVGAGGIFMGRWDNALSALMFVSFEPTPGATTLTMHTSTGVGTSSNGQLSEATIGDITKLYFSFFYMI